MPFLIGSSTKTGIPVSGAQPESLSNAKKLPWEGQGDHQEETLGLSLAS